MTSTPIPPGSVLFVGRTDDNDPASALEVFLVKPNDDHTDSVWSSLGNSFGTDNVADFFWMVDSLGAFHNLQVELGDGVTRQ